MIFNEGVYLTFKSIFHKALKVGIIVIWERACVFLLMLSAKQGNYWYHCFNVFSYNNSMTRSFILDWIQDLPHYEPALYH